MTQTKKLLCLRKYIAYLDYCSNVPNIRWKTTILVRLFQIMSLIRNVRNNILLVIYIHMYVCRTLCMKKCFWEKFYLIPLICRKTLVESHCHLVKVYDEDAVGKQRCKLGRFWLERRRRPFRPKSLQLNALLLDHKIKEELS